MTFNAKSILNELVWLAFSLLLSISVVLLFWEWNREYHLIYIRISGTDVVFSEHSLIFLLWMFLSFKVFIVREFFRNSNNNLRRVLALIAIFTFIISINFLRAGWTSYPPLESLGEKEFTREMYNHGVFMISFIAIILMVVFIIWWVYKWKRSIR